MVDESQSVALMEDIWKGMEICFIKLTFLLSSLSNATNASLIVVNGAGVSGDNINQCIEFFKLHLIFTVQPYLAFSALTLPAAANTKSSQLITFITLSMSSALETLSKLVDTGMLTNEIILTLTYLSIDVCCMSSGSGINELIVLASNLLCKVELRVLFNRFMEGMMI